MLFIVIYESTDVLGKHCFKCVIPTFATWEAADKVAQKVAFDNKKRAWVAQINQPNLIELVK